MSELRHKSIGDILLDRALISEVDLRRAEHMQTEVGGLLSHALLRMGSVAEDDLLIAQSQHLNLPIMTTDKISEAPEDYIRAQSSLGVTAPWLLARDCAVWQDEESPTVHMLARDMALFHIRDLSVDQTSGLSDDDAARLREMAEEAPVIDFVNRVFSMALKDNASDIHIEPFEHKFQVRYRIDGVLHTRQTDNRARFDAVASRIKLLSGMDIAERRLPQDGRQTIRFAGQDIDLRVSSLPGSWGESLVMRLLRKENELPDLEALGLEGHAQSVLQGLLSHPNGVILVTGPTGSGKSTTLYRSLQGLNDGIRKIITIEDPVEYDMSGIVQIQTNASIGYSFAKGLRAILRQDPDIIMVLHCIQIRLWRLSPDL